MTHLGVDGCRAGWIVAEGDDLDTEPRFWLSPTFRDLLARATLPGRITCIDVPIGLSAHPRRCDGEARRMLGRWRASSVFTPPCRTALAGRDRSETRALNVHATGRSLSEQVLGIVPKIREVDALVTPALQDHVKEVHPEVVFAALAGGGLVAGKRTEAGRRDRLRLLPAAFAGAAPARGAAPYPRSQVSPDDYVDALAALYVAVRLARGEAHRLPAGAVERDELGLSMELSY